MTSDLERLLKEASDRWAALSPEERQAMLIAQRNSFLRAELAFGSDADEEEFRAAILSADAGKIAECERKEEGRLAAAREFIRGGF